jgi:hypothetical protein
MILDNCFNDLKSITTRWMIVNSDTNTVFFSSQLSEKKEFIPFWNRLVKALRDKDFKPRLLTGNQEYLVP